MKRVFYLIACLLLLFAIQTMTVFAESSTNPLAITKYNEGINQYQKGYFQEAIRSFQGAIAEDNRFTDAYYNLGCIYEYLKDYNNAIRAFSQVTVLNPKDYDATLRLGKLYMKKGDKQRAGEYFNKIPSSSMYYKEAGKAKLQIYNSVSSTSQSTATAVKSTTTSGQKVPSVGTTYGAFLAPTGITSDSMENIYIASFADNAIYKQTPENIRVTFSKSTKIQGPIGIVADARDNIYVANYNSNNILKITQSGEVSIFKSNVTKPYYLYILDNQLFVSEQGANKVLKFSL